MKRIDLDLYGGNPIPGPPTLNKMDKPSGICEYDSGHAQETHPQATHIFRQWEIEGPCDEMWPGMWRLRTERCCEECAKLVKRMLKKEKVAAEY